MRVLVLGLAALATGCATTYSVPVGRAPAEWMGAGGVRAVANTLEVFEGEHQRGDVLARWQVVHARTGILAQDVRYGDPERDPVTLPAGTPAVAMQFALQRVTTYNGVRTGSPYNMQTFNNPIEWCFLPETGETVCAFWQTADTALYIPSVGSMPALPEIHSPQGEIGTMPVIDESAPYQHETQLMIEMRIEDLSRRRINIGSVVSDGENTMRIPGASLGRVARWNDADETTVRIMGGELHMSLLRDGSDRNARVAVVQQVPLRDPTDPTARFDSLVNSSRLSPEAVEVLTEMLRRRSEDLAAAGAPAATGEKPTEPDPES